METAWLGASFYIPGAMDLIEKPEFNYKGVCPNAFAHILYLLTLAHLIMLKKSIDYGRETFINRGTQSK